MHQFIEILMKEGSLVLFSILETQRGMNVVPTLCPGAHIPERILNRKKTHEIGHSIFHRHMCEG